MEKIKEKLIIIKDKFIFFINRRKHTKNQNLRLGIIVLCILFIIGLFTPMLRIRTNIYISSNENANIDIFNPKSDMINVSIMDFVVHKPLRDYKLFDKKIGDIKVFDLNVYDFLKTEIPTSKELTDAEKFLDSGALDFLVQEDFKNICVGIFGDFGNNIVAVGKIIHNLAVQIKEVIKGINDAIDVVHALSQKISSGIIKAENTLMTIDTLVTIFFLLIILLLAYVIIDKGPKLLGPIALSAISFIFICITAGIIIFNIILGNGINSSLDGLQDSFFSSLSTSTPVISGILSLFSIDTCHINLSCNILCGVGLWFITLSLIVITVLSYIHYFDKK